jgi:GR25 family glycosyltransferase involved in LPS biosynthesis
MIESLLANPEHQISPIFVFADGPKTESDLSAVRDTRRITRQLLGDRAVYVESCVNKGLAASIIEGVSKLCDEFGHVIVIEDDLVLAPSFLAFMNDALKFYASTDRVMQVSGYMFDVPAFRATKEVILLPFVTSWGWATWKRAWKRFDINATGWRGMIGNKADRRKFDLDGNYPYSRMLEKQMNGEIDSWAIRWYFTVYRRSGQVVYPSTSLVSNEGFDGSGTHIRAASFRGPILAPPPSEGSEFVLAAATSDQLESVYRAINYQQKSMKSARIARVATSVWSAVRRKSESPRSKS